MSGKKGLFSPPYNLLEVLGQFSETKEHLLRAGGEIFQALRSALDTIIDISQGEKQDDGSSKPEEEIKQVEIK
ncbi:MAG: hypothetical protein A3G93_07495 [Nitrospinae bacterium RIFCSPLOWO2_12_FULL_45_22]|nr:MAG: hypothetical protein A3G93_07495 [Nitrospinae bacterium RIFCSPLOWO2_12_FULL_45_22]